MAAPNLPSPQTLALALREGGVLEVRLNRPAQRNSLSEGLIATLQAAIDRLSVEKDVAAVVIAAGGPAFSSGHDLKEVSAHRADADGVVGVRSIEGSRR